MGRIEIEVHSRGDQVTGTFPYHLKSVLEEKLHQDREIIAKQNVGNWRRGHVDTERNVSQSC